jgi:hypothetical protein
MDGVITAPQTSPRVSADDMDFGGAINAVVSGRRVRRRAWTDPMECLFLQADILHVRRADGSVHTLMVHLADMEATDWIIVRET